MSGIRFASLNARGLNKKSKRYTVFNKCKNFDVVCLQETYITDAKYESWKRDWPGDFLYTPGSCHSKGQIILINKNLEPTTNLCHPLSQPILLREENHFGNSIPHY